MEKRVASWEKLRQDTLKRLGPEAVFGEGSPDARVAIVGEAPGYNEVRQGRPFVGRAGKLLDELLAQSGIEREEVYITNVVKIRPTREKGGRTSNRPPRVGEIREGMEALLKELELIEPEVLILLGNTPARALVGKSFAMTKHRGTLFRSVTGTPAVATFHPAYLLRQEGEDYRRVRRLVLEDLAAARRALEEEPELHELE
ncbi:uracil-DNA glycosylase [Rubrobacter taiwanensis]|uniref:uracil-DNA glycosylase n=1 Tax=Rubrobacter taiwanensis TaxID=185139 RepID=UPI0014046FCC|nr:uracil-DNA glycosylase [Rubrobacter taiwanensis]